MEVSLSMEEGWNEMELKVLPTQTIPGFHRTFQWEEILKDHGFHSRKTLGADPVRDMLEFYGTSQAGRDP